MIRSTCASLVPHLAVVLVTLLATILLGASAVRADALADAKEALRLLDQLDTKGAEKHLSIAIEAKPNMAPLFVARAHLRDRTGNLVGAGRDALRASELGEDLWQWAAKMLKEGNMFDAAAIAFEGAWHAHNELPDLRNAAKSYSTAGQYKDGIRIYELLAKRAGDDDHALYLMAGGNLRSLAGQHDAALRDLNLAIKLEPNLVRAYHLRGRVKLRLGRIKEGIDDCKIAQKMALNRATRHRTLGLAYFDTGNYAAAIKHLEIAAREDHVYTHFYLYLARCRMGPPVDRMVSSKELRKFLESLPDDGSWALSVGGYLLGDISEKALLERGGKATKFVKLQQLCEAYGYIGQRARIEGNDKKATESFKLCVATNVGSYMEFTSADMDLRRSGKR